MLLNQIVLFKIDCFSTVILYLKQSTPRCVSGSVLMVYHGTKSSVIRQMIFVFWKSSLNLI